MRDNYEACLAITLKWEGGDVNHPKDPGGATRKGVTQARYDEYRASKKLPKQSVFKMTDAEMLEIYKTGYWDAVKGDTLAYGVDLATWDYGVNSGPARARRDLLASIGGPDIQTIQRLCAKRLSFVQGLWTWKTFGKGWSRRIADIEARAVKMSASASGPKASVTSILTAEAKKATDVANSQLTRGKGTLTASAGTGVGSTADVNQLVSIGLLGAAFLCLAFVAFYLWRSRTNTHRADAYLQVAGEKA